MKRKLYVKPREGISLCVPETGAKLPKYGAYVEDNKFWRRRILDKDVICVKNKVKDS